jgi:phosphoglycerate-specific signal transduction histidine kinase
LGKEGGRASKNFAKIPRSFAPRSFIIDFCTGLGQLVGQMAKKNPTKKPRTINQQFASLERIVRTGFRQTDRRFNLVGLEFRALRKEMNEKFAVVEDRIDRLATHVDGFMKLHETLDIELTVMKQQMSRIEERLKRVEAAQAS